MRRILPLLAITAVAVAAACGDGDGDATTNDETPEVSPAKACEQALGAMWDARAAVRERITALAGEQHAKSREAFLAGGEAFVDACAYLSGEKRACLARGDLTACDLTDSELLQLREAQPPFVSGVAIDLAAAPGREEPSFYDRPLSPAQVRERMAWLAGTWKRPHGGEDEESYDRWRIHRDGRVAVEYHGFNARTRRGMIRRHYRDAIGIDFEDGSQDFLLFRATDDAFYAVVNGTGVRRQPVNDRSAFVLDHERATGAMAMTTQSMDGQRIAAGPAEATEWYFIDYRADDRCQVLDLRGITYDATCGFEPGEDGELFVAELTPFSTDEPYRAEFLVLDGIFLDHRFTFGHRFHREQP